MQLRFVSLFSGSSGNSSFVSFGDTKLLIDAGCSAKQLTQGLEQIGVSPAELSGILVTHEHIDHIKGIGVLAKRHGLDVYASSGTWEAMAPKVEGLLPRQRIEFYPQEDFYIGGVNVLPFSISHDAAQPVGFCLECGGKKVSFATDLGHTTSEIIDRAAHSDVLLLEANHDVDMLKNGQYPYALKRRILGNKGHLSNDACADTLKRLLPLGVRNVFLGHLSRDNNVPELAYAAAEAAARALGAKLGEDVMIRMTYPGRASELITL